MSNKEEAKQVAVLVGVIPDSADTVCEIELDELAALLRTAGGRAAARLIQVKEHPDPRTYLGSGKVAELAELCRNLEAGLVVFNNELSPSQIRNLEKELGEQIDVIDRTMLILDIFALHAVSSEGKLQVELAQLKYSAPRLVGKGTELSRQEGRIGTRGPGESKLENDRRYLKRREAALLAQLEDLVRTRNTMRAARIRSGIPKVAIVGYTNAGKSTLLNTLTDAGVLSEDKLFATLDPTTRRLSLPDGQEVLLTDTVGFIRRLPHQLIKAFRSTLEEAILSDLLLLVADVSDPECEAHLQVTSDLLAELGAGELPRILVYNKCDRADSFCEETDNRTAGRVFLSAKDRRGIPALLDAIAAVLRAQKHDVELLIPYAEAGVLNRLRGDTSFSEEPSYREDGIYLRALLSQENFDKYSRFILGQN